MFFELMHCRSVYPMNENDANLNVIDTLKNRYKCNVGYSGHEPGLAVVTLTRKKIYLHLKDIS